MRGLQLRVKKKNLKQHLTSECLTSPACRVAHPEFPIECFESISNIIQLERGQKILELLCLYLNSFFKFFYLAVDLHIHGASLWPRW